LALNDGCNPKFLKKKIYKKNFARKFWVTPIIKSRPWAALASRVDKQQNKVSPYRL